MWAAPFNNRVKLKTKHWVLPWLITFHLSPFTFHLSSFTFHLSPFTFHLSPFTFHLSPLTFHLSPFTFHLSPFTSHFSRLTFSPYAQTLPHLCVFHLFQQQAAIEQLLRYAQSSV